MVSNQEAIKRIKVTQGNFLSVTDVAAWVCFVTQDMSWGGGLNSSILQEAGQELDDYVLENVVQPKVGTAHCCPAFSAPVDHVLLGILPVWRDGLFDEEQLVLRCYKHLMRVAGENGIESIAIPSLGGGHRNFPQKRVARLTVSSITQNMPECLRSVSIVCRDSASAEAYLSRFS